jgi:hypothetical protein
VSTIDQCDAYVGMVDQRIREGHAHGAGSHHEVVGVHDPGHDTTVALPSDRVHGSFGVVRPRADMPCIPMAEVGT